MSCLVAPSHEIQNEQHDHRADKGNEDAREIESGHSVATKLRHDKTTDKRADDAGRNVGYAAHLIVTAGNNARQPSR